MKIQSAVLTNGSGSIGGMTAAKNRGGLYLRARAAVTNPQTPGQTLIRTMFGGLSTAWRTLTEVQRQGWYDWAAVNPITNVFGDPVLMTGHQAFIALNTPRAQAGLDIVEDSPADFGQAVGSFVDGAPTLVIDDPDVDLTFSMKGLGLQPVGDYLTYCSVPQSPTTRFFKGPFNLLGSTPHVADTETEITFDQTKLPAVAEGQVLWIRTRLTLDDGRFNQAVIFPVTATVAP